MPVNAYPDHEELEAPAGDGRLTIDVGQIVANYKELEQRSGSARTSAVVKADAYGTGVARVAPSLARAGVKIFFVAQAHEGAELRTLLSRTAPDASIYVFAGVRAETVETLRRHRLIPVLNSLSQVDLWSNSAESALPAALHVDTGMNRLGLEDSEVKDLDNNPKRLEGIDLKLIMSHLACADTPDHPLNQRQLEKFTSLSAMLPPAPASLANSAGILLGTEYHFDLTRPGIGLYGGNPRPSLPNPMRSAIKLEAPVLQVRLVESGQSVGYGASAVVKRPTRIAVVSAGYADGLPLALGNAGHVYIAGRQAKIIGRISMDLIAVDVTDIAKDVPDDDWAAEVLGDNMSLETLAEEAGTTSYELLTRLGQRYTRSYTGEKD